jgi:hypothetical protein
MATELDPPQNQLTPTHQAPEAFERLPLPTEGFALTDRGAYFATDFPIEEWYAVGRFIKHASNAIYFWRADWLSHGRKHYGTEAVADAVTQLELDLGELKHADTLNRLVERRSKVQKEHHFIVARSRLDDVAQHMWLELSEKENLTPRELEESIRAGRVVKLYVEDYERKGGFASIEGLYAMWKMLRRQIGDLWIEWTDKEIAAFLRYLEPLEAFAQQLRDKVHRR